MKSRLTENLVTASECQITPDGWRWVRFGDIAEFQNGRAFPGKEYCADGVRLLRPGNLFADGSVRWNEKNTQCLPLRWADDHPTMIIRRGELVMNLTAQSLKDEFLGRVCITSSDELCLLNQRLARIRPSSALDARFVLYALKSHVFRRFVNQLNTGSLIQHMYTTQLGEFRFPLAPLDEQRRIVGRIEELFSDLEAGVAALTRARGNLKRYRASVLKAAVEGALTAEWRTRHPPVEPASKLLERLLTERRRQWAADQLGKFAAAGKQPPNNWQAKYAEPSPPNTTNLPTLPDGWCWASWDSVLASGHGAFKRGPFGSALTKSIFVEKGYKVYEQYCPINDDCSFARYYITDEKFRELESFAVREGDFLISCSGVTLGRITRVPPGFEQGIINQALLRVRISENVIDSRYFVRLFRSPFFQRRIFENSTGSAIPNVKGVQELKAIALPLPPLEEQSVIVLQLDEKLSQIESAEVAIEHSLRRAARLRQSILKQAFEGKLVPQDPTDEPASSLLERIRSLPCASDNGTPKCPKTRKKMT